MGSRSANCPRSRRHQLSCAPSSGPPNEWSAWASDCSPHTCHLRSCRHSRRASCSRRGSAVRPLSARPARVQMLTEALRELSPDVVIVDAHLAAPMPVVCGDLDVAWCEVHPGPASRRSFVSGLPATPSGVERAVGVVLERTFRLRARCAATPARGGDTARRGTAPAVRPLRRGRRRTRLPTTAGRRRVHRHDRTHRRRKAAGRTRRHRHLVRVIAARRSSRACSHCCSRPSAA